jgi:hypothetical protein
MKLLAVVLLVAALGFGGVWYIVSHPTSPTTTDGTTATTTGIAPYMSGIKGSVMAGPTCPVEKDPPDPQCADRPLQTVVAIYRASDLMHTIVLTKSNKVGEFEASLPPGSYTVTAGESMFPRCTPTDATVLSSIYTTIIISCDTGIR